MWPEPERVSGFGGYAGAMADGQPEDRVDRRRRVPKQARSRERVERILDAAGELVATTGVEAMSTRAIAELADIPVASLYQYFADKDDILLALLDRDIAVLDGRVRDALAALEEPTLPRLVEAVVETFVGVFRERPAFVVLWLRGRTNTAIRDYGRAHNQRIAEDLVAYALQLGLVHPDPDPTAYAEIAVVVGDRLLQLAFEREVSGDEEVLAELVHVLTRYLLQHATPAGRG